MPRYQVRSEVDAIQFTPYTTIGTIQAWMGAGMQLALKPPFPGLFAENPDSFFIDSTKGVSQCKLGDWIVRGTTFEFGVIPDQVFSALFEPAP